MQGEEYRAFHPNLASKNDEISFSFTLTLLERNKHLSTFSRYNL